MSNLDQHPKPDAAADKLSQKRRALIKGSAIAIPAILTLRSGSALAITSLSCVAKTRANPPTTRPEAVVGSDDNWHRASTQCRTLALSTSPSTTLKVFQNPADGTKWYNVNTNNSNTSVPFVDSGANQMTSNGVTYTYSGTESCFVLIQVDENGNETGVIGASDPSSFPYASDSCWSSLH